MAVTAVRSNEIGCNQAVQTTPECIGTNAKSLLQSNEFVTAGILQFAQYRYGPPKMTKANERRELWHRQIGCWHDGW